MKNKTMFAGLNMSRMQKAWTATTVTTLRTGVAFCTRKTVPRHNWARKGRRPHASGRLYFLHCQVDTLGVYYNSVSVPSSPDPTITMNLKGKKGTLPGNCTGKSQVRPEAINYNSHLII